MADETYSYSPDGEQFWGHYESREAAIEAGFITYEHNHIYTGINGKVGPFTPRVADEVVDQLQEAADELCGEASQGFLTTVSVAQLDRLEAAIQKTVNDWVAAEGFTPTFFVVHHVREHDREPHAAVQTAYNAGTAA
jgi:hypothetical protein